MAAKCQKMIFLPMAIKHGPGVDFILIGNSVFANFLTFLKISGNIIDIKIIIQVIHILAASKVFYEIQGVKRSLKH